METYELTIAGTIVSEGNVRERNIVYTVSMPLVKTEEEAKAVARDFTRRFPTSEEFGICLMAFSTDARVVNYKAK